MFASETSGQDPEPHTPHLVKPESDIYVSITELPSDPLLDPGAFINVNITTEETLAGADFTVVQDHGERDTNQNHQTLPKTEAVQVSEPSDNGDGTPGMVAGTSDGVEFETPVPLNTALPAKTPTRRGRRKNSDIAAMEMTTVSISSVKPEWLPDGWHVEDRVRISGASAGARDKYYCDPSTGFKFRSRLEVIHFQQTGSKRKRTLKEKTSDDVTPLGSSGNRKGKKFGSRTTTQASNFDFVNVPEKIGWVLTDSAEGSWTPFVDEEKVPETSKEEWAATFSSLARNSGC